MLAVNNNIPSNQLTTPSGLEVITVEIHCKLTVTLCVVYIPPNSNSSYHADLLTYLDSVASKSHTFILGDFNYPDINWHPLVGQSDLSKAFVTLYIVIICISLYPSLHTSKGIFSTLF